MSKILFFTAALIISGLLGPDSSARGSIDSLENKLPASKGLEKIEILNNLSGLYRTSSPDRSLEYGRKALQLARRSGNPEWICISLKNTGIACSYLSQYNEAEKYFMQSLKTAEENDLKEQLPPSYNSLGNYYYLTGNLDKAISYYERAYKSGKELGDNSELNSYLSNIGIVYHNRGSYEKALKYYFESLEISGRMNDKPGVSRALTNIGAVYTDMDDYPKALDYYNKALAVTKETNDLHTRAGLLNNIANVLSEQGNLQEALTYHFDSLHLKEKIEDKSGAALSLGDIGRIYASLGKYTSAVKYLKISHRIQKEVGNVEGEIISLVQLGRAFTDMTGYHDALVSFNEAASLAEGFSVKLLLDAWKGKSDVYEKMGNYREAYKSYLRFSELKDSVYNENSAEQVAEIQTKYESEKKDKEISLLQREKTIRDLKLRGETIVRNSLVAGLAVFIIIAFLIYNRYRIKKKTNSLLEEKIREIGKQKNELKVLNENKNKLLSIISHDLRAPFQALLGYSEILNLNIKDLTDEEISAYSETLHHTSRQTFMLFETLLEWSRLQMDKIISKPETFELAEIVDKASSLLLHYAGKKNITVMTDIPEGTLVYADVDMISSVLRNLLSNAVKYSEKDSTVIVRSASENVCVTVVVEDTGKGLAPDEIQSILGGDRHSSTAGTANEKGTGLGLEICKEMIRLNNGRFSIESEIGKGSRFIFSIPNGNVKDDRKKDPYLLMEPR